MYQTSLSNLYRNRFNGSSSNFRVYSTRCNWLHVQALYNFKNKLWIVLKGRDLPMKPQRGLGVIQCARRNAAKIQHANSSCCNRKKNDTLLERHELLRHDKYLKYRGKLMM